MNTRGNVTANNVHIRDDDYSPQRGVSLWETCPIQAIQQDPRTGYTYDEEFHRYVSGNWTVTLVNNSGSPTQAADPTERGGVLLVTNPTGATDSTEFQLVANPFALVVGKPLWWEQRVKVSDSTLSKLWVGLAPTDSTLITGVTDGLYFFKDTAAQTAVFVTRASSTSTTSATVATLADATYVHFGIYWDGVATVTGHVNGVAVATSTTNLPAGTVIMTPSFGLRNGAAAAKTMSIDYIKAAQIR